MSRRRKRTKTLGDVIRLIVMLAALAVFLYSGYTLYGFYKEYKKSSDEYDNLENSYAVDQEQESENIDNLEDDDALQSISGQEVRTVFEDGEEKTLPVLKNPIDFTQLLSVNSDIVGWLRIRHWISHIRSYRAKTTTIICIGLLRRPTILLAACL